MRLLNIVLAISICVTANVGDFLVFKTKYSDSRLFRALADNGVHATLGYLSALLFFSQGIHVSAEACFYNIIFCTLTSSLIDADHFIRARSFYLKDLTNLQGRGFLHCSTLWFAYTILLLIYSCISRKLNLYLLSFMLFIAFTSHHIRDGHRRGLWMFPFGHTPPIHRYLYTFSLVLLPIILFYIFDYFKPSGKYIVVNTELV